MNIWSHMRATVIKFTRVDTYEILIKPKACFSVGFVCQSCGWQTEAGAALRDSQRTSREQKEQHPIPRVESYPSTCSLVNSVPSTVPGTQQTL